MTANVLYLLAWFHAAQAISAVQATPAVISSHPRLPPSNSAWVGEEPHRFLGGDVLLFCGSHGVFSARSGQDTGIGRLISPEYNAVFKGELTLNPPIVPRTLTIEIEDPIVMGEQVTTKGADIDGKPFSTELTRVDFVGSDFPDNVRFRESHERRSTGWTAITPLPDGRYRIQAHYDVWLEVSIDSGRTWHVADNVVRMHLEPVVQTNTLKARRVRK